VAHSATWYAIRLTLVSQVVTRPELARDVGSCAYPHADSRSSCAARCWNNGSGECSRGCVAGQFADCDLMLSAARVASDDGAYQRVPEAWHYLLGSRTVVVKILMQWRRDGVLNCSFYCVASKSETCAFRQAGSSLPPLSRTVPCMRQAGSGANSHEGLLAEGLMLPLRPVGVRLALRSWGSLALRSGGSRHHQGSGQQKPKRCFRGPHEICVASQTPK
jgi:hypothetical protein